MLRTLDVCFSLPMLWVCVFFHPFSHCVHDMFRPNVWQALLAPSPCWYIALSFGGSGLQWSFEEAGPK